MPLTTTDYKHIVLNDRQVPVIEGSTMKVMEIAMAQRAYGWTPEEIHINCIRDLDLIAKLGEPEEFENQVQFLPL